MEPRKYWYDDITLLPPHLEAVKDSRRAQIGESRTWGQLLINRPTAFSQSGPGKAMVLNSAEVRELGCNVYYEAARGARSQICRPLQAVAISIGGDYDQQQACDSVSHWLRGALDLVEFHSIATELTTQSMWATESHSLIEIDPVTQDPRALLLDPTESFWNADRTEFTTSRAVSKRWLKATYAKGNDVLKAEIAKLPNWSYDTITGVDSKGQFDTDDTVRLMEAWIAPVGDEPGRHVVMASPEVVLLDDDKFEGPIPVVSSNWSPGARGKSDGAPLGRVVGPFHCWLNQLTMKVYDALRGSVPWFVGGPDTKLPSDAPFQKIEVAPGDPPPSILVPNTVSNDVLKQIDKLSGDALRTAGISEQASTGSPPSTLKSGVALSKWSEIVSTSLSQQHGIYKGLWVQAARILVALARKHYAGKPVNVQRAIGSDVIEQIKFKDIDLPEQSYTITFEAVNALGDSISQRIENGQVLKDLGAIDTPQFLLHVDLPDLRALTKQVNGPRKYIQWQIARALKDAKVEAPSDFQDAAAGYKAVSESYQAALASPVRPEKQNMEACRILMRLFKKKLDATQPAAPAPATDVQPLQQVA